MPSNRLLIKKPHISEKATDLYSEGKYTFIVDVRANKKEIEKLIKEIYGVTPIKVNVMRKKKDGAKHKKAVVTLKEGDSIDIIPH